MAHTQHLLDADAALRNKRQTIRKGTADTKRNAAKSYTVTVEKLEGDVYLASSEDIKGLVLQTDTLDEMVEEMRECVPWLLEGNHGIHVSPKDISIHRNGKSTASRTTYTLSHA